MGTDAALLSIGHRVKVLEIDTEVNESLEAWKNEEKVDGIVDTQEEEGTKQVSLTLTKQFSGYCLLHF